MKYCCKKFKKHAEAGFIKVIAWADNPPKDPDDLKVKFGLVGINPQMSSIEVMGFFYCPFCGKDITK